MASPLAILRKVRNELQPQFGSEADSLAMLLTEELSQLDRSSIIMDRHFIAGPQLNSRLEDALSRLKRNEPIQHITGKAHFFGREFIVNKHTLIPRPETEELVHYIINSTKHLDKPSILDIGTGSGCIPITLALEIPGSVVRSIDVSKEALKVAEQNDSLLNSKVSFAQTDILSDNPQGRFDLIISNPPYVLEQEKKKMQKNVLDYEPSLALFVPDDAPLKFYARIAEYARIGLNKGGMLFFEINERFGDQISDLLESMGYSRIHLQKDFQGKDRIIKAVWT